MTRFLLALALAVPPQEKPPPGIGKDRMFPDFLLPNVEGGAGRLSDYRGKKVFVVNFASW